MTANSDRVIRKVTELEVVAILLKVATVSNIIGTTLENYDFVFDSSFQSLNLVMVDLGMSLVLMKLLI